jgi:hypothetical protein
MFSISRKICYNKYMNNKHDQFCAEYTLDHNATQAAIRAGYSPHTAKQQGSRLLTNADVRERIAELQDEAAERNRVEVDEIIAKLRRSYDEAMDRGQFGAAIRAAELLVARGAGPGDHAALGHPRYGPKCGVQRRGMPYKKWLMFHKRRHDRSKLAEAATFGRAECQLILTCADRESPVQKRSVEPKPDAQFSPVA